MIGSEIGSEIDIWVHQESAQITGAIELAQLSRASLTGANAETMGTLNPCENPMFRHDKLGIFHSSISIGAIWGGLTARGECEVDHLPAYPIDKATRW